MGRLIVCAGVERKITGRWNRRAVKRFVETVIDWKTSKSPDVRQVWCSIHSRDGEDFAGNMVSAASGSCYVSTWRAYTNVGGHGG